MKTFYGIFLFFFLVIHSNNTMSGDIGAGEARYSQNCGNCHGPPGMGLASYPKLSGKKVSYLVVCVCVRVRLWVCVGACVCL